MARLVPRIQHQLTGRRLVFNALFYLGHLALFAYGWYGQYRNDRLAILNLLRYSVWTSRGAGLCLAVDGALLFLPVCRNLISFFRPQLAFLLPLEENVWFHRQIGYSLVFWTIVHTTAHYVNMFNVERTQVRTETAVGIMYTQPGAFTGHMMVLIMVLMFTTAHARIRKQCFEAFYYTHHLAFLWMIGLWTHASGCFVRGAWPGQPVKCLGYNSVWYTWIGCFLYLSERVLRYFRSRHPTSIVGVLLHPSGAMEVRFSKPGFNYVPGQWVFINVPQISRFQWHPFTISSAPDDPFVSIHVRQVGDFTRSLGDRLGATRRLANELTSQSKKGIEALGGARCEEYVDITEVVGVEGMPRLCVDGPYGAPAEDVFKKEVAVLIGAGIGVTPFSSILKDIYYKHQKSQLGALKRVEFIWINKEIGAFSWFRTLLQDLEDLQTDRSFLRLHMYLTSPSFDAAALANVSLNDLGAQYDALTGLRSRTCFGRPVWGKVFGELKDSIGSGWLPGKEASLRTQVGVFFCGPPPLAKVLKEECKRASDPSIQFSLHKEHF